MGQLRILSSAVCAAVLVHVQVVRLEGLVVVSRSAAEAVVVLGEALAQEAEAVVVRVCAPVPEVVWVAQLEALLVEEQVADTASAAEPEQ